MNINEAIQLALNYQKVGNLMEAKKIYKKILDRQPHNIDALHFLGLIYHQLKQYDPAIKHLKQVLKFAPHYIDAVNNLGIVFQDMGKLDEAIACYKKTVQLNPLFWGGYYNLGNIHRDKGYLDEAIQYYHKALQIDPNCADVHNGLGVAIQDKGQTEEAILHYQKALQLDPNCAEAYNNIGTAFQAKGRLDEAELFYKRAIQIKPDYVLPRENLIYEMLHNPKHDAKSIFSEHLQFAKQFAEPLQVNITPLTNDCNRARRLRIGYVSPDFRRHSVSYFVEPVLASHNRNNFEIFCYLLIPMQDDTTIRIQRYADHWKTPVGIPDEQFADIIRQDKIDILIDLAGHTAHNRILVFACKPVPIQITWIGYPATTGLSTIDYKIVDSYTDPPGMTDEFYTEELLRLPDTFLCYLPDVNSPDICDLPALKCGYITFGSFNNFAKISSNAFKIWSEILKAVPNSRLIIKAKSLSERMTCDSVKDIFIQNGTDPDRIELLSWVLSPREHLETYNRVDIGLDTFPYNGTTTTCEALWMGVPVITLAGNTHVSRVGVSLLSNIGLSELVAKTYDEYIELAANLAMDINKLQFYRKNSRDMMAKSALCDVKRFIVNLENCYRDVWRNWCEFG